MIAGVAGDPLVYLNGEFTPLSEAKISVLDRGFLFGDGIYEVVPVYQGKPFRMTQHMARLSRSLAAIEIANPLSAAGWEGLVSRLIELQGPIDQAVYFQVTRGVAKRDHAFPSTPVTPTVFAMSNPFQRLGPADWAKGITATTAVDERWLHCDIKSVSLLGNVLARQSAVAQGAYEAILFRDGFLTEGAAANIWVVRDGVLLAPPRSNLLLEGIRYGLMEQLAADCGVALEFRQITRAEVESADELLLTSATKEVLPILQLDGRPVGTGAPGAVFTKLRAAYDKVLAAL
jgi:D-alanine transaminase